MYPHPGTCLRNQQGGAGTNPSSILLSKKALNSPKSMTWILGLLLERLSLISASTVFWLTGDAAFNVASPSNIGMSLLLRENPLVRVHPKEVDMIKLADFHPLSSDEILNRTWPEPVWAVPGILPVGLSIIAGAPKVGKSWFALQIAQAVAAGGYALGRKVERGPVIYLALEDPPRRLQSRMRQQSWPLGLDADFLTVGTFQDTIGDLRNGGGELLARWIEQRGYRLVVIDTLSRAIGGDQNEAHEMTAWLSPLQEIAQTQNCALVMVDHHRKSGGSEPDVIADILGSIAKGAMADTTLGLYRERGKAGARLFVTGRDVEEQTLDLRLDAATGSWQLANAAVEDITEQQAEILRFLESNGLAGAQAIAEAMGANKGTIHRQLTELERKEKVKQGDDKLWELV
jgi:DNA-binding NarL/FixJ family response regulator